MSGFYGADTEQLRDHAQSMLERARRLGELRDELEPLVMDDSIWRGTDADAFRQDWASRIAPSFSQGSERILEKRNELDRHAEEQDSASEVGGAAGGSGGGSGEDDGWNPLGLLKDVWLKGQGIYGGVQKMMKFIDAIPSAADEFAMLSEAGLKKLWKSAYLDELFQGGKGWQAAGEKLLSKLGIPNALGDFKPLSVLNKLDDVAPWLKTAGRGLGKVLPAVDVITGGINAYKGFTSGDVYGGVSGSLSAVGGALLIAAPFTGPAAPIVGAIGAGLGIVSVGMDLGREIYRNWDGITSTVGGAFSTAGDVISGAASTASDAIGGAVSSAGEAISDAASTASDAIGGAIDGLGNAFGF
ncbi:hypothetical protein V1260_01550 [Brachybacterium sp. J144]|uniref:hypothetical protein n=1 Tax=Brachybacterium sp. J144 TaxID=3116487 RepID=UPI002E78EF44|nr:hypothetical protein [Brachybacterium sp. J144]MEE1649474.1 hypothetical protein [Brachybacterium sp. J144]